MVVGQNIYKLPVGDVLDFEKEQDRLAKQHEKLLKEKNGIDGRLKNDNFVAKAPPHVIEESKARVSELGDQLSKIDASLERLKALF